MNQCVMNYGSKTRTLTMSLERKLRNAKRGMEISMLGTTIMDKKNCKWVQEQTTVDDKENRESQNGNGQNIYLGEMMEGGNLRNNGS